MTLYEIDREIAGFEPEIDEETGELLNADELESLNMERERKIENVCLMIKNLTAEVGAISAEAKSLTERARAGQKKIEHLEAYLEYALQGQPFKTARCEVKYRSTESVALGDDFLAWALKNRDELLRYSNPVADKAAIKAAIKAGEEIPGAAIVKGVSMTVK